MAHAVREYTDELALSPNLIILDIFSAFNFALDHIDQINWLRKYCILCTAVWRWLALNGLRRTLCNN